MANKSAKPKIIAAASGGGHWIQLLRLRPAFEGFEPIFASKFDSYAGDVAGFTFYNIGDASRANPAAFIPVVWRVLKILLKDRPKAIITTGAGPGLMFIAVGRILGIRTLWVDSIANSEQLSGSGRIARKIAHQTISQWEDVAQREGVEYWGAVI